MNFIWCRISRMLMDFKGAQKDQNREITPAKFESEAKFLD